MLRFAKPNRLKADGVFFYHINTPLKFFKCILETELLNICAGGFPSSSVAEDSGGKAGQLPVRFLPPLSKSSPTFLTSGCLLLFIHNY